MQPWFSVEATTRLIMLAIAVVHAFIWWQTSYADRSVKPPKPPRRRRPPATAPAARRRRARTGRAEPAATGRGADIGRTAGRFVGNGVRVARKVKAKRQHPPTST